VVKQSATPGPPRSGENDSHKRSLFVFRALASVVQPVGFEPKAVAVLS
jgi:hypothetical protein